MIGGSTESGWAPYGFTDAQIENAKVSDCKVCYKYNDKWIPWNEIKAAINSDISDSSSNLNDSRITTTYTDQCKELSNKTTTKSRTGYIDIKSIM